MILPLTLARFDQMPARVARHGVTWSTVGSILDRCSPALSSSPGWD
jgi:hypothetical protein